MPRTAQIEGDRSMLRRALSNLLDNALRFTPASGEVRLAIQDLPNAVRVSVENTGGAISAQLLPRLFDRFYRASTSRDGGSGLGLFIVATLARGFGGTATVESAPGDGSSPDALLSKADIALYAAKADGRRIWKPFEQEMDAQFAERP